MHSKEQTFTLFYLTVNGGWSSWSQFSECSASCNGGTKSRSRLCNSPVPFPEGIPCDMSNAKEHVTCNDEKCPGKSIDSCLEMDGLNLINIR